MIDLIFIMNIFIVFCATFIFFSIFSLRSRISDEVCFFNNKSIIILNYINDHNKEIKLLEMEIIKIKSAIITNGIICE
jgi:hypothetical protein